MIELRDVRPVDRDTIRRWRNSPEVARYMYTDHEIGPEEHAAWFQRVLDAPVRQHWIIVADGEDVGLVNLLDVDEANRRCYWAFYLVGDVRGKGVGSFVEHWVLNHVFEERGFHKLCAEVLAFNEGVLAMHEKFGFRVEGTLREHIFKGGGWHDVVTIGMLRSEWDEAKDAIRARLREKGLLP